MVLNKYLLIRHLLIIFWVSLLAACSHLTSQDPYPALNRSPVKPVIPVNSSESDLKGGTQQSEMIIEKASGITTDALETKAIHQNEISTSTETQLKTVDVLASIIDSAKKAINNQQWLRAQHHLEHALRVAPKDAQVFYLYSEVYEGLGIKEQAINMLKRSIFLAKPESNIYKSANTKLDLLSQ